MNFDRIARHVFMGSLVCGAFVYGLAVNQFKIFPYEIIRETKNGIEALLKIEDDRLMPAALRPMPGRGSGPFVTSLDAAHGDEALLVTGGFYQFMSECPDFGCLAWITDRDGNLLHSWQVDPNVLAEGAVGFEPGLKGSDIRVVDTHLAPDGGLVASFHTRNTYPYQVGIAKFDRTGKIIWKKLNFAHHWFDVDPDGNIYVPNVTLKAPDDGFENTVVRSNCGLDSYFVEGISIYDPAGELKRKIDLSAALVRSGYPGLLYATRDPCDPMHVNSVEYLTSEKAARVGGAKAGDLVVSLREQNMVALLDGVTGNVEAAVIGRSAAQHGPQLLADGRVAIFDNLGGNPGTGGTRVLASDWAGQHEETLFPRSAEGPMVPFRSPDGGHLAVSPDGKRMMISSKHQAVSFEIDIASGKVLWSLEKIFDITPYLERNDLNDIEAIYGFNAYGVHYLSDADLARVLD